MKKHYGDIYLLIPSVNKFFNRYGFLILIFLLSACAQDDDFSKKTIGINGDVETLKVKSISDVILHHDTINKVEVLFYEMYLDDIDCQFSGGELTIQNNSGGTGIKKHKRPLFHVYLKDLQVIRLLHAVNLSNFDTLRFPELHVVIFDVEIGDIDLVVDNSKLSFINSDSGSGVYIFRGTTGYFYAWPRGTSHLDAGKLKSDRVRLIHNTLGDSYVWAASILSVTMDRAGNVYYHPNPDSLFIEKSANGRIQPIE